MYPKMYDHLCKKIKMCHFAILPFCHLQMYLLLYNFKILFVILLEMVVGTDQVRNLISLR
jgi:hypothetical protein